MTDNFLEKIVCRNQFKVQQKIKSTFNHKENWWFTTYNETENNVKKQNQTKKTIAKLRWFYNEVLPSSQKIGNARIMVVLSFWGWRVKGNEHLNIMATSITTFLSLKGVANHTATGLPISTGPLKQSLALGSRLPGFETWFCHLQAELFLNYFFKIIYFLALAGWFT